MIARPFFTPFLKVLLYDENHQQISESPMNTKAATDNRNFWFRISSEIEIPNNTKKIEIIFYNPDQRKAAFKIDQLLGRPLHSLFVQEDLNLKKRMYNNHLIDLK
ncbi:MAG: hypothetical protein UZ11_BCD004001610 [Bacteroidetes bacterium OLB11]|nr:MAG: hypothetical protein UZ11_BCD004001610 [Bacteroidetes bacterium OLB11]